MNYIHGYVDKEDIFHVKYKCANEGIIWRKTTIKIIESGYGICNNCCIRTICGYE